MPSPTDASGKTFGITWPPQNQPEPIIMSKQQMDAIKKMYEPIPKKTENDNYKEPSTYPSLECRRCGALVMNTLMHDDFHDEIDDMFAWEKQEPRPFEDGVLYEFKRVASVPDNRP